MAATRSGQREVRWISTYLKEEEQGHGLTAATTHGSAKLEGAQDDCRGDRSETGGERSG